MKTQRVLEAINSFFQKRSQYRLQKLNMFNKLHRKQHENKK